MGILEELWYGNISPCERDFKRGSTYSELLGYIVRHEEDLQKRLNDEEKEISSNCDSLWTSDPFCDIVCATTKRR